MAGIVRPLFNVKTWTVEGIFMILELNGDRKEITGGKSDPDVMQS